VVSEPPLLTPHYHPPPSTPTFNPTLSIPQWRQYTGEVGKCTSYWWQICTI